MMKIENVKYEFDVSNGEFIIKLNDNEVIKYTYYNNDNVVIASFYFTVFPNWHYNVVCEGIQERTN